MKKILIAAGGSGGHLFPAQQLTEALLQKGPCEVVFAGYKLSKTPFFEREKIPFHEISSAPLKKIFPFLFAVWKGFWQSIRLLRRFQPDLVVGFGSFHSFPVLLAATVLRKKIVLFEANCILGKVNRLFLPFSEKIGLQFPLSKELKKGVFVPLLPWFVKENKKVTPTEARQHFHLDPDLFTILVFGGSQGAVSINQTFCEAADLAKGGELPFQVIHLTGPQSVDVEKFYQEKGIRAVVKPFEKEMALAYAASDMAVCRAGAGTIAELIRYQKPAVLIPYPYAAEAHQDWNAFFLADKIGGARVLLQKEATPQRLLSEVRALREKLDQYREALGKESRSPQNRKDFASVLLAVMGEN